MRTVITSKVDTTATPPYDMRSTCSLLSSQLPAILCKIGAIVSDWVSVHTGASSVLPDLLLENHLAVSNFLPVRRSHLHFTNSSSDPNTCSHHINLLENLPLICCRWYNSHSGRIQETVSGAASSSSAGTVLPPLQTPGRCRHSTCVQPGSCLSAACKQPRPLLLRLSPGEEPPPHCLRSH